MAIGAAAIAASMTLTSVITQLEAQLSETDLRTDLPPAERIGVAHHGLLPGEQLQQCFARSWMKPGVDLEPCAVAEHSSQTNRAGE
eukprot:gene8619-8800_t